MNSCPQTKFESKVNVPVTLNCTTFSNPPPDDYVWTFKGETLSATGPTLEITPLSLEQFGEYTCLAINVIGPSEPLRFNVTEKRESMLTHRRNAI